MKKLVFILALLLLFTTSACSNNTTQKDDGKSTLTESQNTIEKGGSSDNSSNQPEYTVQYFFNSEVKLSGDTTIGKIIKDKLGFQFEFVPYTGDYNEKLNLMLAAGDYPELLAFNSNDIYKKYIEAGALVSLDDYLDSCPNFISRYKEQIPYWKMLSNDGKLYKWEYSLPQSSELVFYTFDVGVRSDALEKQGWPNISSADDYVKFLKQALKDSPDTDGKKTLGMVAPFAEQWDLQSAMFEKGGAYSPVAGNVGVIWNQVEQKYEDFYKNKYVKESLQFFNRLYREGILDKECFTDHMDQVTEKLKSGSALCVWYCTWPLEDANSNLISMGHPERQYVVMPIRSDMKANNNERRQGYVETTAPFCSVAITKNAKDPARLMQVVDWVLSEEGQILTQSGVKDVHYTIKNGNKIPTEEFLEKNMNEAGYASKEGFGIFRPLGWVQTRAKDGLKYTFDVDGWDTYTERQQQVYKMLGWKNPYEFWQNILVDAPGGIASSISIDPSSELGRTHEKMIDMRFKNAAKLIMSRTVEEFESNWESIMAAYEKLNPQSVVDKYNELLLEGTKKVEIYKK